MKTFNIVIVGVGGQGLITLAMIIAESAMKSGFDIKTSELHGLSQREGSVKVEVRFGSKVWSPLAPQGKADLVLALESQEALAGAYFADKNTSFLINQKQVPTLEKSISEKEILDNLKKISKNIELIPASKTCEKKFGSEAPAGIYLLGRALAKKLLPLSEKSIISAIKKILPKKHWNLNLKTLKLANSL